MKKSILSITLSSIILSAGTFAEEFNTQKLLNESRATSVQFGKSLKGDLKAALQAGGPINGIKTCNTVAPELAKQAGDKAGVELSRTSLKLRNPENAPDKWETSVLQQFENRKASGESAKEMEYSEIIKQNGDKQFRYMKAIAIEQACLNCHGEKLQPSVVETLDRLYPDDKARGYKLGDIRGAFSLKKAL